MKVWENKQDIELIDIVMNCELDFDCRKHAAMEAIKRSGVNKSWDEIARIMSQ